MAALAQSTGSQNRLIATVTARARVLHGSVALCGVLILVGHHSVSAALNTYQFSGVVDYTDTTLGGSQPPLSSVVPLLSQGNSFCRHYYLRILGWVWRQSLGRHLKALKLGEH